MIAIKLTNKTIQFILTVLLIFGAKGLTISGNLSSWMQTQEFTLQGSYGMLDPSVKNILFLKKNSSENPSQFSLIMKNVSTGIEVEIDKRAQQAPLGWLDSANILIYKSYKSNYTPNGEPHINQVLYKYNIFKKSISPITSIPLDSCFNNIFNAGNTLIFGTTDKDNETTKIFRYNLENRKREEFSLLQKRDIELNGLTYNKQKKVLGFIEKEDSVRILKILKGDQILQVEKLQSSEFSQVTFDKTGDRLFYTNCKTTAEGIDEYFIKSYNLVSRQNDIIYKLSPNETCTFLDNYDSNNLLISLNIYPTPINNIIDNNRPEPVNVLRVLKINKPIDQ